MSAEYVDHQDIAFTAQKLDQILRGDHYTKMAFLESIDDNLGMCSRTIATLAGTVQHLRNLKDRREKEMALPAWMNIPLWELR